MAYFFYWWKQRDSTVHRMVYELIRQGRLQFVGGGFSMSDEATTSYHAIIDMFTYSLERINSTFLDCGRPLVSWQSDVTGHSREFAALMSQMGFGGHFVNPISYDDEVSRMISKSMEFVWRGSDDLGPYTDLFAHKLFDGYWSPPGFCFGTYCGDPPLIENEEGFKNVEKRVKEFIEVASHRQGPYYTTRNIMIVMGQRFGYFDAGAWFSNIDKLIKHVNIKSAELGFPVHLFYSSPACYLKAVSEANPELATKQDDFFPFAYDQYSMAVGIYTARPTTKYFIRQAHVYLQISKQLQMTARLHAKHYDPIMERFKWINSVVQDHNIITGVMTEHTRLYYTHKLYLALQTSTEIDVAGFNKLRKSPEDTEYFRCSFNISVCQNSDATQYFIVIYNPLAWEVTVKVRLPTLKRDFMVFHPSGKRVKAALIRIPDPVFSIYRHRSHAKHELVFVAEDVPALGFRSYFIKLKSTKDGEDSERRRRKRTILKKFNRKHKTKKYLVKQAYQALTEDSPEEDLGNFDYEYFETPMRTTPKTKILFTSVENDNDKSIIGTNQVITPRTRLRIDDAISNKTNSNATTDSQMSGDFSDVINNLGSFELNDDVFDKDEIDFTNINVTRADEARRGNTVKNMLLVNKNISLNNITKTRPFVDPTKNTVNKTKVPPVKPQTSNHSVTSVKDIFVKPRTSSNYNFTDKNKELYIEPKISNSSGHKNRLVFKSFLNKSRFNDDIEILRRFNDKDDNKNENKPNIHILITDKIDTTPKDIFSEEDRKPDSTDVHKKRIEEMARHRIDGNELAMIEEKLKNKEYADLGIINVSNENKTNKIVSKTPFDDLEDVWMKGRFGETIAGRVFDENKWIYKSDDTTIETTTKIATNNRRPLTTTIKLLSAEAIPPIDLKDSDFSDVKISSEEINLHRNDTRKYYSVFGSDEEAMRNHMFGIDGDKSQSGEHKKNEFANETRPFEKQVKVNNKKTEVGSDYKKHKDLNVNKKVSAGSSDKKDEEWGTYYFYTTNKNFIANNFVKICLDKQRRLANISLSNGLNISFNAEMYYYLSDDPKRFNRDEREPGITMFRVMDIRALLIDDTYKVKEYRNRIVHEFHFQFATYASFVMRLYRRDPVIELEWQVGPVPIADGVGKELFIRYTTNLQSQGTFYTDSNGRQTVKRIRNRRYTYEPMSPDHLAGNIYPVTSKIYIEDELKNIRFSVFNDRAQGGTSLADGEIDLFLHRRILTDDTRRGILILNETEHGQGVIVRGKHYIYLTKADYKPNRIFEKKLAKEIELAPQIFVTKSKPYGLHSKDVWMKHRNEYSALKTKLPIGVHILTLEKWGETGDDLLLRLENYLERPDALKAGIKKIRLKDLFVDISITSVVELSLGANMRRSQLMNEKFYWKKNKEFYRSFNDAYGDNANRQFDRRKPRRSFEEVNLDSDIVLVPQQIRTFCLTYEYIGE
ncbi:lysosomal alpha-mannosidase-like [Plodia interpunctella]|uniref:lysosomal alpha-mannosidase-like n=1 Tax=Plodia interpunctella TaxID=58824 RepID=UPI002367FF1C|nr:lysosomal alpha-mannosidase-like [Plodia interpunctella]